MSITTRGEHKFYLLMFSVFPNRLSIREYGALLLAISLLLDGVGVGEAYKSEFPNPIIMTEKGKVEGVTLMANSHKVDAFLGIPYAQPPVGELRFKQPVQKDPWKPLVWDATKLPNSCWQSIDTYFDNFTGTNMWNANTEMSEDCLYLNVWVPRVKAPYRKKSVIVWIYGGGFYSGSSTLQIYMPEYLATENDVIVVSMQYRVGSLGFLALDTDEVTGNAGLFDQRMALEWINRNIEDFGGDPRSVTLMGESAGAVSVGLFLLCPICRGYYHRAILQSGSPTAEWGVLTKHEGIERSRYLANFGLQCTGNDAELIRCLRSKNASELNVHEFIVVQGICQFPFVPIVDGVFIPEEPREMLRLGKFKKVPLLLGSNSNEGTFFIIYDMDKQTSFNDTIHGSLSQYSVQINRFFQYYPIYGLSHQNRASSISKDAIRFQYRNWKRKNDATEFIKSIDNAVSDYFFVCKVNELAVRYTEWNQPVYYYWFNQRWSDNPWPEWMGVLHADEIWFTFGHPLNRTYSFTEGERQLSRQMMRFWTNFAKTGDPNKGPGEASSEEWPTFGQEQRYKMLSVETMRSDKNIGEYPRTQRCAFWDEYLPKLEAQTSDINEIERQWKEEFHLWKNRYIVDWKTQFDSFIRSYQERMGSCGGGRP